VEIAFRASGGAAANILLIEEGGAQLGMTTVTVAMQARNGLGAWTGGVKFQAFRALFPMFPSVLQIVSPRSTGIMTLADLAGHVVGVGPDGSSGAAAVPAVFTALGVKLAQAVTGDFKQQMQDMLAGKLEACAFIGGPPLPAISRAAAGQRLSLIGFSKTEIELVALSLPGMMGMVLGAGTFPGQNIAVASVGTPNFAIGAATIPDALAGALTMAALRNQKALATLVPAAAQVPSTAPILQGNIMFHPGAVPALRRFGMDVPAKSVES
jgi:hypothetical protein